MGWSRSSINGFRDCFCLLQLEVYIVDWMALLPVAGFIVLVIFVVRDLEKEDDA